MSEEKDHTPPLIREGNNSQPPGWIDKFFDWLKNLVKEKLHHFLYAMLTIAITYIMATWQKADATVKTFSCLPNKVEAIIRIHTEDSLKATKHLSQDSIADMLNRVRYNKMAAKMDSLEKIIKIRFENDELIEQDDWKQINRINKKLHL